MHPLALEDLLHVRNAARSKADYYQRHLFLRILRHSLIADDDDAASTNSVTELPRSSSPIPIEDDDDSYWDELKGDEDKTVSSSSPPSRFATKTRITPLGSAKRRMGSRQSDVEAKAPASRAMPAPRFASYADFDDKVCMPSALQ